MKKRKTVPSGSGRNAVPTLAEFANLEWLNNHINHRAETVTNIATISSYSEEEGGDVVLDEGNVDEQERPSELVVEDVANSDNDSRASTQTLYLLLVGTLKIITTIKVTNTNKKRLRA